MQVFRRVPTAKSCILDGNYGRVMTSILVFFFYNVAEKERESEREGEGAREGDKGRNKKEIERVY